MKSGHRILAAILAFAIMMSLFAWGGTPLTLTANAEWDGTVATSFYSGSGTSSSPYIIKTAAQMGYFLKLLSEGMTFSGMYLKLNADLDMTGGNWSGGSVATKFCGDFNGNGYKLTMDSQFIQSIGEGGRVRLLNIYCANSSYSLICDYNYGTIEGCVASGKVTDDESYAGGLVRGNYGAMLNVGFTGEIGGPNMDVGGLVCNNYSGATIKNAYCSATLSAYSSGKYGAHKEDAIAVTNAGVIENVYYDSAMKASTLGVPVAQSTMKTAGFATTLNQNNPSLISKWVADTASKNGGFPVPASENKSTITCNLSYSDADAFICASGTSMTIVKSGTTSCTIYYTTDGTDPSTSSTRVRYSSAFTVNKDVTVKMVAYESGKYGVVRSQKILVMSGSGTESSPYQITNKAQLEGLHIAPDACFSLQTNLTFSDSDFAAGGAFPSGWLSVEKFTGMLIGNGRAISNLQGVDGGFIRTNEGTIRGVRFLNHQLTSNRSTYGSVADYNTGTITQCYVDLNVTTLASSSSLYAGGIVGSNSGGEVSYCQIEGDFTVTGPGYKYCWIYVGGIANYGTVESCYSQLDMIINSRYTTEYVYYGGISHSASVKDCRNDGTVHFDVALDYDIYAYPFSTTNSYTSYGSLDYTKVGSINVNRFSNPSGSYSNGTYSAVTTDDKYLESKFPKLDFTEKWMITATGPMPQGMMDRNGNCYRKTGYTIPTCRNGSTVMVDQYGNTYTEALPASGIHGGGTATCSVLAVCIGCGASYGSLDGTNHTGVGAAILTNDATYPFTLEDGRYTSTNKVKSTTSVFKVTAKTAFTITVDYSVSSEPTYDKFIIEKNGTTLYSYSGATNGSTVIANTGVVNISLQAGDVLQLKYSKDTSMDKGDDEASFALTIPEPEADCTNGVSCYDCQALLIPALGHSYLVGTNSTTAPFSYNNGVFTSTNKADSSTATYTYTAYARATLEIDYTTSSEANCDKLIIKKNSTNIGSYSGETTGKVTVTVEPGDKLYFSYSKDRSYGSFDDCVSFAVHTISASASCTEALICKTCAAVIQSATGHTYQDHACVDCGAAEPEVAGGTCGENATWKYYRDKSLVISGTGAIYDYSSNYNVPWYTYNTDIVSVVIGEGITRVGEYSFSNLRYMTSLTLPSTLKEIGYAGFRYANRLTEVTLPDALEVIDHDAFYEATALKSIVIPEGVSVIGRSAFSWCTSLETVQLPSTLKRIETYGFCSTKKLQQIILPEGLEYIGEAAFVDCMELETVRIPASVTQIEQEAFGACDKLQAIWVDEDNAHYYSDERGVLYTKDMTTLVQAPGALTGSYTVVDGTTYIEIYALYECKNLTEITLPTSLEEVAASAFYGCSALKDVNYDKTEEYWDQLVIGNNNTALLNARKHFHQHVLVDHEGKASTCTETGWAAYQTCENCDYTTYTDLELADHSYAEQETKAPACMETGIMTYTCTACGDSYTEEISATGHSWSDWAQMKAPTCTKTGIEARFCDNCDTTETQPIPARHTYDDGKITTEPTCVATGTKTFTCIGCGDTYTEEVAITDHKYEAVVTAPTCTQPGYTTHTCVCGETYTDSEVAATGHIYDDGIVTTAPTCTTTGIKTFTCTGCEDSYTEEVAITEHEYEAVVTDPTCTQPGYTTHTCVCGETYTDSEVEATGHSYNGEVTKVALCPENGIMTYTCPGCGDSYTEEIIFTEHPWGEWMELKAATCTKTGIDICFCDVCGESKTQITPVSHSFENGSCTSCGEADPDYVPEIELFELKGSSMTLGNTLEINFAVDNANITGTGNYIVVSKEYADGSVVSKTYPQAEWTKQGTKVSYVSFSVTAKEMNDQLTVIVYNENGEQISNTYTDSVAGYCLRKLKEEEGKAAPRAKYLTLFVDMLNYGAAAQTKWNYNTDALANAELTEAQKGYATVIGEKANILQKGEGYKGTSLSLKDNILLNVAYNTSFLTDVKYAEVNFVSHNGVDKSVTVAIEDFIAQGSTTKYISIDVMAVADYAQPVTVKLYNTAGECVSTTIDSMGSYAGRQAKEVYLYEAILAFGMGAYNYFHS